MGQTSLPDLLEYQGPDTYLRTLYCILPRPYVFQSQGANERTFEQVSRLTISILPDSRQFHHLPKATAAESTLL